MPQPQNKFSMSVQSQPVDWYYHLLLLLLHLRLILQLAYLSLHLFNQQLILLPDFQLQLHKSIQPQDYR